jgi:predicted phosphohydrolase
MLRIVCLSDTHCAGGDGSIDVPSGDLLIHAGDLTFKGTVDEIEHELAWLDSLPHKYKVVVAGNHDWLLSDKPPSSFRNWPLVRTKSKAKMLAQYPTLTYLQDASVTIEGHVVYGSPWQPWYYDWAFNFPKSDRTTHETAWAKWQEIPDDTNILVTHSPPRGILDNVNLGDDRAGCPALRRRVDQLEHLRLHAFGHLHESYGREDFVADDGAQRTFVNAAIMTREYKPRNAPIVVDI